jgi:3-oxoacyl-[acyl-carrier-protein] synthase II
MTVGPAYVRAVGAVTPAGVGIDALVHALRETDWQPVLGLERPDAPALPVARCRDFEARQYLPPLVVRRLDRSARLLAVAAREAAGAERGPMPWPPERTGVCAGTWNAGTDALLDVLRTVFLASPDEAPPMQFPSTVANAPASQLAILEKWSGPNLTFAEKQVGGVRAVAEAVALIRRRRADAVIAGGVDEAQWLNAEGYWRLGTLRQPGRPGMVLAEGAAVALLSRDAGPAPLAVLAGSGSAASPAPPHRYPEDAEGLVTACRSALETAGLEPAGVDAILGLSNGLPRLAAIEREALEAVFGRHRPAALALGERVGEGAFTGALRVVVAALAIAGRVLPAWPPPDHLAGAGFSGLRRAPRSVLVPALAGGGSAVAVVLTAAV